MHCYEYPRPALAADLVVVSIRSNEVSVLLVQRGHDPYRGHWAVPGGFVDVGDGLAHRGEGLEEAALRELVEETGISSGLSWRTQLATFGRPNRDPRGRVVSVIYLALTRGETLQAMAAGDDAVDVQWFSLVQPRVPLAFDHAEVLGHALTRTRGELRRDPTAIEALIGSPFTQAALSDLYVAAWGNREAPDAGRDLARMIEDGLLESSIADDHTRHYRGKAR